MERGDARVERVTAAVMAVVGQFVDKPTNRRQQHNLNQLRVQVAIAVHESLMGNPFGPMPESLKG